MCILIFPSKIQAKKCTLYMAKYSIYFFLKEWLILHTEILRKFCVLYFDKWPLNGLNKGYIFREKSWQLFWCFFPLKWCQISRYLKTHGNESYLNNFTRNCSSTEFLCYSCKESKYLRLFNHWKNWIKELHRKERNLCETEKNGRVKF